MGWVRFDDKAIDHPKFLALSASAFRLWFEGMTYSNRHLTDGFIAVVALKGFRYVSKDRIAELVAQRLWERSGDGYQVHDYLDWNDDKATVQRKREDAKQRAGKSRTHNARALNVPSGVGKSTSVERNDAANGSAVVPDDIGTSAAQFLDRFQGLYIEHRRGAHYHLKPNRDWLRVCELLQTYEPEHLTKLATIILTTDDDWVSRTDRGIGILAARASWADDRLREWEAQQAS
jgi:hypothetical protein